MKIVFILFIVLAINTFAATEPSVEGFFKKLSSDEMEGRAVGSKGIQKAANYINEVFSNTCLKSMFKGGFFQEFNVSLKKKLGSGNDFEIKANAFNIKLELKKDFIPFGFSESGEKEANVVFAGYGISSKELNYDSYKDLNVKGKFAVVLTGTPDEKDKNSPFRKPENYYLTEIRYKVFNAKMHEAAGVLIVHSEKGELFANPQNSSSESSGIFAINITKNTANIVFAAAKTGLEWLLKHPKSFSIKDVVIKLKVDIAPIWGKEKNIIGEVGGSVDEYIFVIAHYDHLGFGGDSSADPAGIGKIHNGADDNASGVAGLYYLINYFCKNKTQRKILIAAFSGEEHGTLGSTYFVKNLPVEFSKIKAVVNMDMIGRLKDKKLYIQGADTAQEFQKISEQHNKNFEISYMKGGFGSSDHMVFYAQNMPVLFFFTGPHEDYHKPTDDFEKINLDGFNGVVEYIAKIIEDLSRKEQKITFVKSKDETSHMDFSKAGRGFGVYFGSVPDFSGGNVGYKLGGVKSDSPAEKAGLKIADIIIEFDGVKINGIEDFSIILKTKRAGDKIRFKYLREGKIVEAEVILESRKPREE